jgi:ATP synthase F0 subunit b
MDSLISTFHIDWHLIVAQAINFAIVFAVLYWFALKPLGKLMEERKHTIEKGLNDARENAKVLEQTKNELEQARLQALAYADQARKDLAKDLEKQRDATIEKTKAEVAQVVEQGKKQLADEKAKSMEEAKKEIANLVISATEKVLEGTVKGHVEEALVEKSIKEVTHS